MSDVLAEPDARASPAAVGGRSSRRGRPLPRVRRPARARALRGRLPGRRRRARASSPRSRQAIPAPRRATIFAENLLGGTCARVCPVEVLCQGDCVLVHEGRRPIEIGALQRYATDWAFAHGVPLRELHDRQTAGASRSSAPALPGSLRRRACRARLRGDGLRRARRGRRARPLRDRAVPPANEPLPDEARLLAELGVEFRLRTRIDAARLRRARGGRRRDRPRRRHGRRRRRRVRGRRAAGRLGVAPVHRAAEDRDSRLTSAKRVAVIGGGNTAVDVAREAVRLGADVSLALPAHRAGDARLRRTRSSSRGARASSSASSTNPVAFVGDGYVEGVGCAEMRLGEPDESGRRRPEPVPGSEFVLPADTVVKAIGQQPREEFRDAARVRRRGRPDLEPEVLRRRRRRQRRRERRRGRARGEARGRRNRRIAAMRELTEIRWHARAGQGAKTAAQILALALLRDGKSVQAFPEYGPERRGAPLRAFTRIDDRPIRRHDSVTEPDLVVVLEPSLVRRGRRRRRAGAGRIVLFNGEDGARRARRRRRPLRARHAPRGGARLGASSTSSCSARSPRALGEPTLEQPAGRGGRDARPQGRGRGRAPTRSRRDTHG